MMKNQAQKALNEYVEKAMKEDDTKTISEATKEGIKKLKIEKYNLKYTGYMKYMD